MFKLSSISVLQLGLAFTTAVSAAQQCQPTPNLGPGPLYTTHRPHVEDGVVCKPPQSAPANQTVIATSIFSRTIRHGANEVIVRGQVKDTNCNPIGGALIDIWQTDPRGRYSAMNRPGGNCRGYVYSSDDGFYEFRTFLPGSYGFQFGYSPIPGFDLPLWGARHIHVAIQADGFKFMATEIQFDDDPVVGKDFRDRVVNRATAPTIAGSSMEHEHNLDFVLDPAMTEDELELSKKSIDKQMFTLFCEGQTFDVPQPHHVCRPGTDAVLLLAYFVLALLAVSVGGSIYIIRTLLVFVKDSAKIKDE